jgi:DNA-binding response OmpR family regulator
MRVLVIENEQRMAENIVAALLKIGLALDHALDGLEGVTWWSKGVYDAAVLTFPTDCTSIGSRCRSQPEVEARRDVGHGVVQKFACRLI